MKALESIHTRINAFGEKTPAAPISPKAGCKLAAKSGKNTPDGEAYAPPKYLAPIAKAV